ncbi:MAG: tetratricopeptide repeat protein [Pseudomonadota bacterium]
MRKTEVNKHFIVDGYAQQIKQDSFLFARVRCVLIGLLFVLVVPFGLLGCATGPGNNALEISEQQQEQIVQRQQQALQAEQIGDLSRALALYQEILSIQPSARIAERATRMAGRLNRWDEVRSTSAVWLQLEPRSGAARQMKVMADFRTGYSDDAVAVLADEIERAPDLRAAWQMALGLIALSAAPAQDTTAAESAIQSQNPARSDSSRWLDELLDATGNDQNSSLAWFQRSRLALQMGEAEQALRYALRANEAGADYVNSMWAASLAAQLQQYEQAEALYAQARELEPDADSERAIQAVLAQSEVLNQLERPDESLALLQTLPDSVDTLYGRALILLELDQHETALTRWQQMARMVEVQALDDQQSDRDRAAWLVAVLAEVLEQDEQAIDWYGRVDGERASTAQLRRAGLMARNGQLEVAREVLSTLRAGADPGLVEQAYLVESEMLIEQDQPDVALDLLIRAVSEQPANTNLLYGRAMAAVQADQLELAEQDLRTIIQRDSENAFALNALGYTLSDRTDRQQEAYRLIERALALEPENPAILDSMGWVLFKLGQPEQALPYLERAVEGDFHPEIVAHLIEVLWTLERQREAQAWLARVEPEFFDDAVFTDMLERTGLGQ